MYYLNLGRRCPLTLEEYSKLVEGIECIGCGRPLKAPIQLDHYDHRGGWVVDGFSERQWLYVVCPSCYYQNALRKLGIAGCIEEINESALARRRRRLQVV